MSEVINLPARTRDAGALPVIVPNNLDEAYRMGQAIQRSGLAPKSYQTAEAIMVAIMAGMEVGFRPLQALQSIAVVNGKPTIYGDGLPALVYGSGLCEDIDEGLAGEGDARHAWCETRRRGKAKMVRRTFSVADAKRAGLWNKSGPWTSYPERMLQMRARAFCLRDAYADVLAGLGVYEEVRDYAPAQPSQSAAPVEVVAPAPVAEIDFAGDEEPRYTSQKGKELGLFEKFEASLEAITDPDAVMPWFNSVSVQKALAKWPKAWPARAQEAAENHAKRLHTAKPDPAPVEDMDAEQVDMRCADEVIDEFESVISGIEDQTEIGEQWLIYKIKPSIQANPMDFERLEDARDKRLAQMEGDDAKG